MRKHIGSGIESSYNNYGLGKGNFKKSHTLYFLVFMCHISYMHIPYSRKMKAPFIESLNLCIKFNNIGEMVLIGSLS